eukprot:1146620-Pelagomonas_calceolata.AAC.1
MLHFPAKKLKDTAAYSYTIGQPYPLCFKRSGDAAVQLAGNAHRAPACFHPLKVSSVDPPSLKHMCAGVPIDGAALRLASQAGHLEVVRLCLNAAPHTVNEADDSSYTALHYAAFEGHADVVQVLVSQANADVSRKTRNGYNALHFASTNKHVRTQQILLTAGMQQIEPNCFRERTLV